MPTYEFRCPAGHTFDRFMKMSEAAPELPCPECGEMAPRQLSGGAGLLFKGSGFYLTDYGRNAHRTSGGKPAGEGKGSGGSGPGAGGSTPASGGSGSGSSGGGGGDK